MKFYPYSKLKSTNLSLLLFTARFLGVVSILGFSFVCLFSCYLYLTSGAKTQVLENGLTLTMSNDHSATAVYLMAYGFLFFIAGLVVSGVLAALVSIEQKLSSLSHRCVD